MRINDLPVTAAEFDQFYGKNANEAIGRHARQFDADDYAAIAKESADAIDDSLRDGDLLEVGRIIAEARKQRIADLASRELYQRVGVIKKEQVVS